MEYSMRRIQRSISKAALACMIGVCTLFIQGGSASGDSQGGSIEIISNGIKYESIKAYKEAERLKAL
jgi:hypothetical protein